jgi:hypothetical protein
MATYPKPKAQLRQCPYSGCHLIKDSKYLNHIKKCNSNPNKKEEKVKLADICVNDNEFRLYKPAINYYNLSEQQILMFVGKFVDPAIYKCFSKKDRKRLRELNLRFVKENRK